MTLLEIAAVVLVVLMFMILGLGMFTFFEMAAEAPNEVKR